MTGWIKAARRRRLLMCFTLAALPALHGCGGGDENAAKDKKPAEVVEVSVTPVRTDSVQRSVEVVGTLFGQEDVIISNKVPGKVIAIYKDIGDRVAPGETLAQLLRNDYQLTLNERQSALQEALSTLGLTDVPDGKFDLEKVPAVRRAQFQAQNAKDKLDRARQLHEAKPPLISDQDFADLQTEAKVAQSAHEAAVLEAQSLLSTARTRKAQVAIAEQALRDTTIRAPRPMADSADGDGTASSTPTADASDATAMPTTRAAGPTFVVAARYSSEGELNAGLTKMFRLVIDDPLKLRASVPERHAGQIKVGQKVLIRVEAERKAFPGVVARINPQIDPANRSFEVEVSAANPEHVLKPGAFARAEIETLVEPDVLLVPETAVVSFAGVKKVYTVKDSKAVEVPIETGVRVGDWIEITKSKNLKPSMPVVTDGVNRLAGGTPVSVHDVAGAPTTTTKKTPTSRPHAAPR